MVWGLLRVYSNIYRVNYSWNMRAPNMYKVRLPKDVIKGRRAQNCGQMKPAGEAPLWATKQTEATICEGTRIEAAKH